MSGFRSFIIIIIIIESKLFQLVVEEGRNFFSLKIFEREKHLIQPVFIGKNAAQWLMHKTEHTVIEVNPSIFSQKEILLTNCNKFQLVWSVFISDRTQSRPA